MEAKSKPPIHVFNDVTRDQFLIDNPDGEVITLKIRERVLELGVNPPTRQQYARFRKAAGDVKKRDLASENLALDVVAAPNNFSQLLETYPAVSETVAAWAIEAAGLVDVEGK